MDILKKLQRTQSKDVCKDVQIFQVCTFVKLFINVVKCVTNDLYLKTIQGYTEQCLK